MLLCAVVIFSVLAGETCLFYLFTNSFDLKLLDYYIYRSHIEFNMFFFRSLSCDLITSHDSEKQAQDGNSVTLYCNYTRCCL